jgi:hypothetical protein
MPAGASMGGFTGAGYSSTVSGVTVTVGVGAVTEVWQPAISKERMLRLKMIKTFNFIFNLHIEATRYAPGSSAKYKHHGIITD